MKSILSFSIILLFSCAANAQSAAPETAARQAYMVDVATGTQLYSKDADTQMAPSSMSKMLTVYMVFDALKNGKLQLTEELPVSEHAWKQEGSRMFLNLGQKAKVEDLIRGVVIQSGNDAAVVFAEALGGSEDNFATMLNAKAKDLGLTNSHFVNATGLPNPQHYSTAHDLATVGTALIRDFPEYYHYFSEIDFTFNNIHQENRNPLLYRKMDVGGIKTGHTDDGGFGLTASALRNGQRLVLVLNGMTNMQMRADESAKLLDWAYRTYATYPVVKNGDKLADAKVWLGKEHSVPLVATQDVTVMLSRDARPELKTAISFDEPVQAPISKGQQIGKLTITAPGMEPREVPLAAAADVEQLGFFQRVSAKLRFYIKNRS
jgi:serine-type D-Ala-D-Ala carboxypeptidase (penicillin-binding protein 5/6)